MGLDIGLEVRKQLNFIIASCRLYDEGRYEESLRIAVSARVLFHNTKSSKAVIGGHVDAKDIRMLSTTMFNASDPIQKRHTLGFIGLYPSIGGFRPFIMDSKRREEIPLHRWWAEEPIMALMTQETITRRELILACANKDGGAHVDEIKPQEYERLERGLDLSVVARFADGVTRNVKLRYANLAALRQIGHEILASSDLRKIATIGANRN
jgi:hypothetical protein